MLALKRGQMGLRLAQYRQAEAGFALVLQRRVAAEARATLQCLPLALARRRRAQWHCCIAGEGMHERKTVIYD